jgi:porin
LKQVISILKVILIITVVFLLHLGLTQNLLAQNDATKSTNKYKVTNQLGGPNSVIGTVREDKKSKNAVFSADPIQRLLTPYFDFKQRVKNNYGLSFGIDYNILYQVATESLDEKSAASGSLRFFGYWTLLGRNSENKGTFVYKVENRHRIGTDITPTQLAPEIGYAGLTATVFTDAGWELTNFYWEQILFEGQLIVGIGIVDTTDYVNIYSFVNPWTDFNNLAFLNDPTIPTPNQGLGGAFLFMFNKNIYLLGGLADTNGDPSDPFENFNTFFNENEYFTNIEIGWISSFENRYKKNIHLTAWHADSRNKAQVPDGWGLAFSFNYLIENKYEPFFRAGYSDGGGALSEWSVSSGMGYHVRDKGDLIAIGLNWGKASEEVFEVIDPDQYTVEIFYRIQLFQNLTLTPDIQFVIDPVLNPDEDFIVVFGLRARVTL